MDKTQQAAQLRLAADILETGHPWHLYRAGKLYDADPKAPPQYYASCPAAPEGPFEIRPVLATPPDGRTLHNPGKLTAEQVGVGYRLFCKGENNGQHANQAEMWIGKWVQANDAKGQITTYRVPLSVPWPEAEKPDPYAELKEAHAAGKMIEGYQATRDVWEECPLPAWTAPVNHYRIKPEEPAFQLPPPPKETVLTGKGFTVKITYHEGE